MPRPVEVRAGSRQSAAAATAAEALGARAPLPVSHATRLSLRRQPFPLAQWPCAIKPPPSEEQPKLGGGGGLLVAAPAPAHPVRCRTCGCGDPRRLRDASREPCDCDDALLRSAVPTSGACLLLSAPKLVSPVLVVDNTVYCRYAHSSQAPARPWRFCRLPRTEESGRL